MTKLNYILWSTHRGPTGDEICSKKRWHYILWSTHRGPPGGEICNYNISRRPQKSVRKPWSHQGLSGSIALHNENNLHLPISNIPYVLNINVCLLPNLKKHVQFVHLGVISGCTSSAILQLVKHNKNIQ